MLSCASSSGGLHLSLSFSVWQPGRNTFIWRSCFGRKLQAVYAWLMVTNKQVQVKTTVRSVLFIFSPVLFLRCISHDVERADLKWRLVWRESGLSLCRPRCQRFTTLLWPQLLSKWQTVWQSQVVGNLSWRPLKQVAPGPSLQGNGRQTSDKQLFVLGHVLPSSPLLFSPLQAHFCYWAALLVTDCPCTLIVLSIQMRQIGRFCWVSLISLSFNTVSRCKTVTLLPFDPVTSFIGLHSSIKVNIFLFYTSAQWPTWMQPQMFLDAWRQHIKE